MTMPEIDPLEVLDFEPTCSACDETASWFVGLTCCDAMTVMCLGCYARWETLIAFAMGRDARCRDCGHTAPLAWDWYRTERI